MLKIRLQRGGKKHKPYYKIVVANSRSPRDGKFVEDIGFYNPLAAKDSAARLTINKERYSYWAKNGAQPTERVEKLLKVSERISA